MATRGRKRLPPGTAKNSRETMFLTDEQSKMLDEVAARLGIERSEFMRSAVLRSLSAAVERWGEEEAAKIVADRLHSKWLAECSDPEGAEQWARRDITTTLA